MKTKLLLIIFLLLLVPSPVWPAEFTAKVIKVYEGDTLDVLYNGQTERIRLNGIYCPKTDQPFGQNAKDFTFQRILGKEVTVQPYKRDRHGRTISDVLLADGTNVSQELVKAGLAWHYKRYSKDQVLADLETKARTAKQGLWGDPRAMAPWEKQHPMQKDMNVLTYRTLPPLSSPSSHDPTVAPIIGNRKTHVYHRPDCPSYTAITLRKRVVFSSPLEAEAAGYRVAGNCPR